MGLFARFRNSGNSSSYEEVFDYLEKQLETPDVQLQLSAILLFLGGVLFLRLLSGTRLKSLSGEHILNLEALNEANLYKEVFLAYLNCALLEPVLAIGGMQQVVGQELIINIFTLGSICWWIWMVTDAFDYADVMQHYKYQVELRDEIAEQDDPAKYERWLRLGARDKDSALERQSLVGSVHKDIALWFMLACIGVAWLPGIVTHRDVMHAYVVVTLWIILHHSCRKATTWSTGYFVTFLFPSTALMPLEYCMPFMDTAEFVEDLEFVENYRAYVMERTGVELIIEC